MAGRSPRAIIGIARGGARRSCAAVVVVVVAARGPAAAAVPVAPKFPQAARVAPGHPVARGASRPRPPQAFCEARDIAMVSTSLRAARTSARSAAARRGDKNGAPATCHATDGDRELSTRSTT